MDDVTLIAGASDPVMADYAAWAARSRPRRITVIAPSHVCEEIKGNVELHSLDRFSARDYLSAHSKERVTGIVIFAHGRMANRHGELFDTIADLACEKRAACICVISSFRVHFGDRDAKAAEDFLVNRLVGAADRIVVIRPAYLLSPHSGVARRLRRLRFLAPLVPSRFRASCLEGEELFAAIDHELESRDLRRRVTYTLLGPNVPWKSLLARERSEPPSGAMARALAAILQLLLIGQLLGLLFDFLVWMIPGLRPCSFDTLYPAGVQELLALYNKYNYRNVQIVGYNNGVVHFGHSYPGKTIVSTVRCNRLVRIQGSLARFDGGVTVRQAMQALRKEGKELYVIPNYTYVSMGTTYFVPIHGSANTYSTIGETIAKVLLYDPSSHRFIAAQRNDPQFGEYMYNMKANVLLLRLTVRVREKARYYVQCVELTKPSSAAILGYFHDEKPSNVEVRKAKASSDDVRVRLYYTTGKESDVAGLDVPRDALGSIWDRLESNAITSFLFHTLIRRLAYHVELFLSEQEFAAFWETHSTLPLSKIQLRYIKCDGMPHSPFRFNGCVSADLIMLKKHKNAFDKYLRETLPSAALNPGKHSR